MKIRLVIRLSLIHIFFDVLHLDDMADVGGGKSVNLPDLLHGVVAFIVHEVCPTELVQMGFGVIGAPVFSFGCLLYTSRCV